MPLRRLVLRSLIRQQQNYYNHMVPVSGTKPIALFSLRKTAKTAGAQSHSVDAARRFLRAFPAKEAVRKIDDRPDQLVRRSRRPLRGLLRMRVFLMPSNNYLMPRGAQLARLEARTTSLQLCFRCTGFRRRRPIELDLASPTSPRPSPPPKGGEG